MENLVNDHEKLSDEYSRLKQICDNYELERDKLEFNSKDNDREIQKLRLDIIDLRKETGRQRDELSQNHT